MNFRPHRLPRHGHRAGGGAGSAFLSLLLLVALEMTRVAGGAGTVAAAAGPLYPDLVSVIPPQDFQILTSSGFKEFRYTHHVFNAGAGPLEIRPVYDSISQTA